MNIKYIFLLFICTLLSCVPTKVNQHIKDGKVQKREGKWIESNATEHGIFVSKGKYKKGLKIGVWRTFIDHKIDQKEIYQKEVIKTKFFHPNGKVKKKGQSTTEVTDEYIHWYYNGDWKYYNEKGKLIFIKKYNKGKPLDSISYQK